MSAYLRPRGTERHDHSPVALDRVAGFIVDADFSGGYTVLAVMDHRTEVSSTVALVSYRNGLGLQEARLLARAAVLILTENLAAYLSVAEQINDQDVQFSMEDVCDAAQRRVDADSEGEPDLNYPDHQTAFRRLRVVRD